MRMGFVGKGKLLTAKISITRYIDEFSEDIYVALQSKKRIEIDPNMNDLLCYIDNKQNIY